MNPASPASSPTSAPFTPEQKEYLQGFMAGVAASGVFVGTTASGQLTADPGAAATPPRNLAAPAEATVHGTPLAAVGSKDASYYYVRPTLNL